MTAVRARRIGVYGGTFDPPHLGHIHAAEAVVEACSLDEVLLIPTGDSYHKEDFSPVADRLAMTELAVAGHPLLSVSRVDIDRDGPTYTVDTLADLRSEYPDAELFFILGIDAYAGMSSWKDSELIASMAQLIVLDRPDSVSVAEVSLEPGVNLVEIAALPISATECRARVSEGKPLQGYVAPEVEQYIEEHNLYRSTS